MVIDLHPPILSHMFLLLSKGRPASSCSTVFQHLLDRHLKKCNAGKKPIPVSCCHDDTDQCC